jgi:MFS family permease
VRLTATNTFRSLRTRNYRLYVMGQLVSLAGTFMQIVAQAWLVLKLTGSGTALGFVTTLQFTPILLLGGIAGVLVDRVDRRRLYLWTQSLAGLEALALGVLTVTGSVRLWMVYVMAGALGVITALDLPVKSAIVMDMVGPADLTNAISLNMAMNNTSRVLGPALAGVTIAAVGIGPCFLLNAASFGAVIVALLLMRPQEMHPAVLQPRRRRQFREGLHYVLRSSELLAILVMSMLLFGVAWEFDVVVPLMARYTFHGGAGIYGLLTSALGAGAVVGALVAASRNDPSKRMLISTGIAFSGALILAAFAPSLPAEVGAMALVGATGIAFASVCSSRLQLQAAPAMRGRVMALWSVAVVGSRPIGAPFLGYVSQHLGPRFGLGLGAVSVLLLALPSWWLLTAAARRTATEHGAHVPGDAFDPAPGLP